MIAIIDYGVGNLFSLSSSLRHLGLETRITREARDLAAADRIILPGVGAFADAAAKLRDTGLVDTICGQAAAGKPLLGICLGMQMLFDEGEEFGLRPGLGLIPGRVVKLPARDAAGAPLRVPQVGWNGLLPPPGRADFAQSALRAVQPGGEVYFVHSYEAKPACPADRLADTLYGGRRVCAAARRGSVTGCQFHPEKSGEVGLSVLRQFLAEG